MARAFIGARRSGAYYRVCKPEWHDCSDTAYAKANGARWNPRGRFGALYLCATIEVAATNARNQHTGRAIGLFSLRPERRPQLQRFDVSLVRYADIVSAEGVAAAGLPADYPYDVGWQRCQPIGAAVYDVGMPGIACRSAAECTKTSWLGEELAVFDSAARPKAAGRRRAFADWYPDLIPVTHEASQTIPRKTR
ncbi:MAG: RES family NAD+ phosphorylase [Candidatus Eremiobacteraeota bacterium]|nr:RES family NAD+ phosphorylase [Candidatus Eremiobacteraeota bacterium]